MASNGWYQNLLCFDMSKNSDFIKSKIKYVKKLKNLHLVKKHAKKDNLSDKRVEIPFDGNFKVDRFESCSPGWACNGQPESIGFTVNKFVNLFAIGLYGSCRSSSMETYDVEIQVKEEKSGRLVGSQSGTYACIGPDPYIVRFNYPLGLFANTTYVITARIQGPDSYKGVHGKLSIETRLLSGKKIRVDFSNVYGQKNNSSVKWGQIPFMIFS